MEVCADHKENAGSSRQTYLFVGAIPHMQEYRNYTFRFTENVRTMAETLGAVVVKSEVVPDGSSEAAIIFADWNSHRVWNGRTIPYQSTRPRAAGFPCDCFVQDDWGNVIVDPSHEGILQVIRSLVPHERVRTDPSKFAEGGMFAPGDSAVVVREDRLTSWERAFLEIQIFPFHSLLYFPSPEMVGLHDMKRLDSHIDQIVGAPLTLSDGSLLVPAGEAYLQKLRQRCPIPKQPSVPRDVHLKAVPQWMMNEFDVLNYPYSQGVYFLGPVFNDWIQGEIPLGLSLQSKVVRLPHETEATDLFSGSIKCKTAWLCA